MLEDDDEMDGMNFFGMKFFGMKFFGMTRNEIVSYCFLGEGTGFLSRRVL